MYSIGGPIFSIYSLRRTTISEFPDIPGLSQELIDNLRERFPTPVPEVDDTLSAIQREAGKQEMINFLQQHLDMINMREEVPT